MNARDDSLAAASERAAAPAAAPTAEGAPRALPGDSSSEAGALDYWLLSRLRALLGEPPLELAIGNGARVGPGTATPVARVTFASRSVLAAIVADPWVRFGDAYSDGSVIIEGELVGLLESIFRVSSLGSKRPSLLRRATDALRRPHGNTPSASRDNIHHHYDIGNEFYTLWLGSTMAYTCAYYPTPSATLDEAQIAKMDHVCRKLRLRAGERVVEAGCGWGTLALHMARHYGVRVRAFNISHQQIVYARERALREGLSGSVEYVEDDYRSIDGRYDAFVSVGMLEHVGLENYPALGRIAHQCLGGSGRGLIHSIGRNRPAPLQQWIGKRIFPGAYPPTLAEMMRIFEPWNFSVLDVENLRLHYAQTLRQWLALYESASERVRALFDEKFVRMWRLYLAGSVAAFTTGSMQLFQVLFAPGENNDIAWTREHLYRR